MISCFNGTVKLTSPIGERIVMGKSDFHQGIDLVGVDNNKVFTMFDGLARTLVEPNGFGNYVRLDMENGLSMYFAHLSKFSIIDNTYVKAGTQLGIMGATGFVTGAHTHIELRVTATRTYIDIHELFKIPKKIGTYKSSVKWSYEEAKAIVQEKCGLEPHTMAYLDKWNWNKDLFIKLAMKMII